MKPFTLTVAILNHISTAGRIHSRGIGADFQLQSGGQVRNFVQSDDPSAASASFSSLNSISRSQDMSSDSVSFELPADFAQQLLMEINRIRVCHNAISTGPVVNEACFDDDDDADNSAAVSYRSGRHGKNRKRKGQKSAGKRRKSNRGGKNSKRSGGKNTNKGKRSQRKNPK